MTPVKHKIATLVLAMAASNHGLSLLLESVARRAREIDRQTMRDLARWADDGGREL